jgi:hypothetical protein
MLSDASRFLLTAVFGLFLTVMSGGAQASSAAGTLQFSAGSYNVSHTAGSVTITVSRAGGSTGAARVTYATRWGTALNGVNFGGKSSGLSWASGDAAAKTISVPILNGTTFSGTRSFSISLSNPTGASLGSQSSATINISGGSSSPITSTAPSTGTLGFSASSYSVTNTAKSVTMSVGRGAGSSGAASVRYSTEYGSALNGVNFGGTSSVLSWANGDTSVKNFTVPILSSTFTGTRSFTVALSNASGAKLGTPTATVNITSGTTAPPVTTPPAVTPPPPSAGGCAKESSAWVTTGFFDYKEFGNDAVNNDNWGALPGEKLWVNDQNCWGVTASASNTDVGSPRAYPHATRGWANSGLVMQTLSTPGTNDWTTKSGMGIAVTALTKAKLHWAFTAPTAAGSRWDALEDIYFHKSANPAPTEFPPAVDLQIIQSLADQVVGNSTFYALVTINDHGTTVTIGGNKYVIFVDDPGSASFHQPGGHTIAMFNLPTAYTSNNGNPIWGVTDAVTDIAAVIKYLMQSHPLDDAGQPLLNAVGIPVTSPLIAPNLFLTSINAGWEIDVGATFNNTAFCIAMQNELDCP